MNSTVVKLVSILLGISAINLCCVIFSLVKQHKHESITISNVPVSDVPCTSIKFYVTCVCTKSNKARIYRSFVTDCFTSEDPSEEELGYLRSDVLAANPEYNDCVILFFGKLKG